MACDVPDHYCYDVGRTSTPEREGAMRQLMVVIAIFGAIACSGTDSQDDGGQEAPACESHDDCGADYCVTYRTLKCESSYEFEFRCIACDDPPCEPGPICDTGETCQPEESCTEEWLESRGDTCELQDGGSACKACYEDDHCRGELICQSNICIG